MEDTRKVYLRPTRLQATITGSTPYSKYWQTFQKDYENWLVNIKPEVSTKDVVNKIIKNKQRYANVVAGTNIPWQMVAVVHLMESSCNFNTHLHNGDPLTARTVHEPKNKPETGSPPFTWEESAIDAITLKEWHLIKSWSHTYSCFKLEQYNGFGYRYLNRDGSQRPINPYLVAGSNLESPGKFTADGSFDPKAISKQIGALVIYKELLSC